MLSFPSLAIFILGLTSAQLPDIGYPNFNCPNAMPSPSIPTDVNRVRPGDIKVIGAIGDSLTASMGAGAISQDTYNLDFRGMSWSAGGETDLETHITVPNILKKVNPQLFGQALGTSYVNNWNLAQLNAAIDGQKAEDLIPQARDIVAKMNAHGPLHNPANYSQNIQRALTILQQNLPRTIVNLVSMQNWELWEKAGAMGGCSQKASKFSRADNCYHDTVSAYQQAAMDIQASGSFDRSDFTVIVQPFWVDTCDPALRTNGTTDPTFWTIDCFHYSNKGNAIIAKMLWNNMMEPVGQKQTNFNLSDPSWPLKCPDTTCPYIRTVQNSLNCTDSFTLGS